MIKKYNQFLKEGLNVFLKGPSDEEVLQSTKKITIDKLRTISDDFWKNEDIKDAFKKEIDSYSAEQMLFISGKIGYLDGIKKALYKAKFSFKKRIIESIKDDILYDACENGYGDIINYLLPIVNNNAYVIGVLLRNKHIDILKQILHDNQSMKINFEKNTHPGFYLYYAVKSGDLEIVKTIVEMGADVDWKYEDEYPIGLAVAYGFYDILKYLIEKGADVQINNNEALEYCVIFDKYDIAKFLLKNGADVNNSYYAINNLCKENNYKMLELFLQHCDDVPSMNLKQKWGYKEAVEHNFTKIIELVDKYDKK